VLLFIREVSEAFEITEELAAVHTIQDTFIGNEIFLKVKETISTLKLDFKILKGVTTNGECNICGILKGLTENVCKTVLETGVTVPLTIHCIIHQQALCGKSAPISEVMNIIM